MIWANLLHIYQPANQKRDIFQRVFKESYQKIFSILEENKHLKITLNINACLTELFVKFGHLNIIDKIKFLAQRKQIELLGSAKYHPLLPLLPKREVIRQIKLNENLNQKYFKDAWRPRPQGFFLPELAYNKKTARIIEQLGYKWLVLDEIAEQGQIGRVSFEQGYKIKDLNLKVLFRNRGLSDIFFTGWLNSTERFFEAIKKDGRSNEYLLTAMDGENLGHHKKGMSKIWQKIASYKGIKTLTYSELIAQYSKKEIKTIEPVDCSWSSGEEELKSKIPYAIWNHPQNEIQQSLWKLFNLILKLIERSKADINYKKARKLLDENSNSDPFWWVSASPWWQPGFVIEYIDSLLEIVNLLKIVSETDKKQAKSLSNKTKLLLDQWDKSGKAKQIRKAYLKGEDVGRYFGGKEIR